MATLSKTLSAMRLFVHSTIGMDLDHMLVCRNCDFPLEAEDVADDGYILMKCHGCNTRIALKMPEKVKLAYELLAS